MISRLKQLIVILALMLISQMSYGKTMEEYIGQKCHANCVDQSTLIDAARIAADTFGFDYLLILAIIRIESNFNKRAKNGSSVGLMQVHLRYHRTKFKTKDPFNAYDNIFVGASILSDCYRKFKGHRVFTLRCYNGGGNLNYSSKVIKVLSEIQQLKLT